MTINNTIENDVCHLALIGDIKIYDATRNKQQMLEEMDSCRAMHLDLSQVEEIDVSGLQLLILLRKEVRNKGISFLLTGASTPVSKLLELYRLKDWFQAQD